MNDIIYPHTEPKPIRIPAGYMVDLNDPWILHWRYPVCKYRELKERICCHGLRNHVQYCNLWKHQVYNECYKCQKRET